MIKIDKDIKAVLIFTFVLITIIMIIVKFTPITGVNKIKNTQNNEISAVENELCAGPTFYLKCKTNLICSTDKGKIIKKDELNKKYFGHCYTQEKVNQLQKEFKNIPTQ